MSDFFLGVKEWQSKYADKKIIFDKMPTDEWQYMATATGRTGVVVIAKEPLILQINHEGALDERGYWYPIARIMFDFDGCPLSIANKENNFSMVHDLEKSVIKIFGKQFSIAITAYMDKELIGVEVIDERETKKPIKISTQIPYFAKMHICDGILTCWHENGKQTCWHEINIDSGMQNDDAFEDVLMDRCFGFAMKAENACPEGNGWYLTPAQRHMLWITAESGKQTFPNVLLNCLKEDLDKTQLDKIQAKWFDEFWAKVWFECAEEKMRPFVVAYELYRYFGAISSGCKREFPTRFQILILCNVMEKLHWATMQIHSVQTLEAYFGMYRLGDWASLTPLINDYKGKIDFYKAYTSNWGAKEGFFIPYETNMWGTAHYHTVGCGSEQTADEYNVYTLDTHKWSMYSYEHGLAILLFLWDVAKAKGEEQEFETWGMDAIHRYLLFFLERYAQKDGKLVLDPATSGETWFKCKNPTSWIALFKSSLPQIMRDTKERFPALYETASSLFEKIPNFPIGVYVITEEEGIKIRLGETENSVLLPAEEIDRHPPINVENPELYCLWPYGLFGSEEGRYDLALRTYQNRLWKNLDVGWGLDCIWAARLGLVDEAMEFAKWQFDSIVRFPGGLSYEAAPMRKDNPNIPVLPSMQGMGTLVIPLFEMICQDRNGYVLLLPAWPKEVAFRIAMYTALTGRMEIEYNGLDTVTCYIERMADVRVNSAYDIKLILKQF